MIEQIDFLRLSLVGLGFFSLLLLISSVVEMLKLRHLLGNSGQRLHQSEIQNMPPVLSWKSSAENHRNGSKPLNGTRSMIKTKNSELENWKKDAGNHR